MSSTALEITFETGLEPELLHLDFDQTRTAKLSNHSGDSFQALGLTVSYYNDEGYLDFEDLSLEDLEAYGQRTFDLTLQPPEGTTRAVVDLKGEQQTWLKRHWRLISTVVIIGWGVIVLSRRLFPSL